MGTFSGVLYSFEQRQAHTGNQPNPQFFPVRKTLQPDSLLIQLTLNYHRAHGDSAPLTWLVCLLVVQLSLSSLFTRLSLYYTQRTSIYLELVRPLSELQGLRFYSLRGHVLSLVILNWSTPCLVLLSYLRVMTYGHFVFAFIDLRLSCLSQLNVQVPRMSRQTNNSSGRRGLGEDPD